MYNWSVDETELKKNPEKYAIWKLEQQINFGLNGEKIKEAEIRKYWPDLHLDPYRKQFLALLLFGALPTSDKQLKFKISRQAPQNVLYSE